MQDQNAQTQDLDSPQESQSQDDQAEAVTPAPELSLLVDDVPSQDSLWRKDAPTNQSLAQFAPQTHPLAPQEYLWVQGSSSPDLWFYLGFKLFPIALKPLTLTLNNGFFDEKGIYYLDLERLLGFSPMTARLPPHLILQGYYSCDFLLPKNQNLPTA